MCNLLHLTCDVSGTTMAVKNPLERLLYKISELTLGTHGQIAQWLEHLGFHQKVLGSIPSLDTLVSVDFIILTGYRSRALRLGYY